MSIGVVRSGDAHAVDVCPRRRVRPQLAQPALPQPGMRVPSFGSGLGGVVQGGVGGESVVDVSGGGRSGSVSTPAASIEESSR